MARRRRFRRTRGGGLLVTLSPAEASLLAATARDVRALAEAPPEGEVRDRLYPRAYLDPTEERAQSEFDALTGSELADARHAAFDALEGSLARARAAARGLLELELAPDEEARWVTAINDARLVLGTTLGVTEDDEGAYAPDDPRFQLGLAYAFLTEVHVQLVELLLGELGEDGTDDAPAPG